MSKMEQTLSTTTAASPASSKGSRKSSLKVDRRFSQWVDYLPHEKMLAQRNQEGEPHDRVLSEKDAKRLSIDISESNVTETNATDDSQCADPMEQEVILTDWPDSNSLEGSMLPTALLLEHDPILQQELMLEDEPSVAPELFAHSLEELLEQRRHQLAVSMQASMRTRQFLEPHIRQRAGLALILTQIERSSYTLQEHFFHARRLPQRPPTIPESEDSKPSATKHSATNTPGVSPGDTITHAEPKQSKVASTTKEVKFVDDKLVAPLSAAIPENEVLKDVDHLQRPQSSLLSSDFEKDDQHQQVSFLSSDFARDDQSSQTSMLVSDFEKDEPQSQSFLTADFGKDDPPSHTSLFSSDFKEQHPPESFFSADFGKDDQHESLLSTHFGKDDMLVTPMDVASEHAMVDSVMGDADDCIEGDDAAFTASVLAAAADEDVMDSLL